ANENAQTLQQQKLGPLAQGLGGGSGIPGLPFMDLEHARLVLRGEHGLAVDRGRIVREAVAVVLADLESRGDASILVRRLRGR
ncbi:hypothetical protein ACWDO6_31200, partial [Streptomyces sp. NPDC003674]